MTTVNMISPTPFQSYQAQSGTSYASDKNGFVPAVALGDVMSLLNMGCSIAPLNLIGMLIGANFNITTDQAILMMVPASLRYRVTKITGVNTSVNGMSTAAGGVYPAAAKAGTALVAAGQVYTGLTNALTALDLTLATAAAIQAAGTNLFFSLTTGQGAAATADLYVYGDVYV